MTPTITSLALGSGLFGVNCYLVRTDLGFPLPCTAETSFADLAAAEETP